MKNFICMLITTLACGIGLQANPSYIIPIEEQPFEYICRLTFEKDRVFVYLYSTQHTYEMLDLYTWVHADDRCLCFLKWDGGL